MARLEIGGATIELVRGDLTRDRSDAIVNAANSSLLGGGGVDGAIHRVGGSAILAECRAIRENLPDGLPTGQAVITTGGNLGARYVIHTVGPIWSGGREADSEDLASCYRNSLALAMEKRLRSVAFPSISTGAYRYPVDQAASVALRAVKDFLLANDHTFRSIRFVLFSESDLETYKAALEKLSRSE